MNRRTFLQLVATVGGTSAVYGAMGAMGLLAKAQPADAVPFPLDLRGNARGRKIIILGAGVAGLCAAYELGKLGYDCRVLEARSRVGGRCHTIRRGTIETETDGQSQTCNFDDGQYLNPGPTRIPQQHITLDYCRELNVAIEQFGNLNESAYLYRSRAGPLAGKRVRLREARADMYGYVAEMLAKAVSQRDLDKQLSADDKNSLLQYLMIEGGLSPDLVYRGGSRRGYSKWAGAEAGVRVDPFSATDIIRSGLGAMFAFNWQIEQQPIMFQIVGGMDRLPQALAKKLDGKIELAARVTEIRQTPNSVKVSYLDRAGAARHASAEFCICTIPLPVLKNIPADFSKEMTSAISAVHYEPAVKIGLQFKRRFWEQDDRIFSGISRTDQTISQIMYPSCGFLGEKGVLVGCYNFGGRAQTMGDLAPAARLERALSEGEKIHPQYRAEFETGFSVAWQKTPFNLGAFSAYSAAMRKDYFDALREPDGRIFLAGEHLSYLTGWIGGALESARRACALVHDRAGRVGPTTGASSR